MLASGGFIKVCQDYKCDGFSNDVCYKPASHGRWVTCKKTKDWHCEMADKKTIGMIFAVIAFIVALIASSFGCGAICCCQDSFTEMVAQKGAGAGGAPQPVVGAEVVGLPVEQETNDKGGV